MSKTIITQDNSQDLKLTDAQKYEIIVQVYTMRYTYYTAALKQVEQIRVLRELIYQAYPSRVCYGETYVLPDIAEYQNILLSNLMNNVYSSNDAVFDVKGLDDQSINNAPMQKSAILYDMENMNFKKSIEDILEDYTISGELIAFINYEEKRKKKRAKISELQPIVNGQIEDPKITALKKQFPTITKLIVGDQEIDAYYVKTSGDIIHSDNIIKKTDSHVFYYSTVFEGTKVVPIKALDFWFDVQKVNRFEDATKIWRKWLTPQEIEENENYKGIFDLDANKKQAIFDSVKELLQTSASQQLIFEEYMPYPPDIIGNQVEVLDFEGDLVLSDGTELKNYNISVSRNELLRCEPKQECINNFVYYAPFVEPEYRRGISPLRLAIIYNAIRSNIANAQTDMLALTMNPPFLSAKGQFEAKKDKFLPGGTIEYDPSSTPSPPQPLLQFAQGLKAAGEIMQAFENCMESATGLTKNLAGSVENQDRTATEIRFSQQSGDIRLQFQSDKIKRNFNMNLIETIADVKALYESDSIQVLTTDPQTGKDKMVEIDSVVRNGRYRYSYLDDKSIVELQQKFNIMSQWCEQFIPMGFVNVQELFTEGLEQLGVKNPEKLIQQDPVTQVVSQATQNAPDDQKPQIQNQLKQTAAGLLQQHLQQQQTGQQQQPMG